MRPRPARPPDWVDEIEDVNDGWPIIPMAHAGRLLLVAKVGSGASRQTVRGRIVKDSHGLRCSCLGSHR
jgi:hypothetical protein